MRIAFCGVGAVGSTAVWLCRSLEADLRLVDFDRVESKNLLAQMFVKTALGKNKATAMKMQLANFFGRKSEAFGVRLTEQNAHEVLGGCALLVDAFDNAPSRQVISSFARTHKVACVHAGLSGDGSLGLVRWDSRFTPDAADEPEQATCEGGEHLPLIGMLGACLARSVQAFVLDGVKIDHHVALSGIESMQA